MKAPLEIAERPDSATRHLLVHIANKFRHGCEASAIQDEATVHFQRYCVFPKYLRQEEFAPAGDTILHRKLF